jgi:hypothetical protein
MSLLETTVTTRHRTRLLVPVMGLLLLTAACGSSTKVADVVSTSTTSTTAASPATVNTPSPSTTVATTPAAQVASVEVISADVDRSLSDVDTALAAIDQDANDKTKNGD